MEKMVKSSGDVPLASVTLFSSPQAPGSLPSEPKRKDPFFAVPSVVIDEPRIETCTEDGSAVSITF